jgi:hypothetical protein
MVATLAAGTFVGMMLAPASGSAFPPAGSPTDALKVTHTTPKTSRLPRKSDMTATQAASGSVKAPGACTPSSAAPRRFGPIAYV